MARTAIWKKQVYRVESDTGPNVVLADEFGKKHEVGYGDEHLVIDPTDDEYFAAKAYTEELDRCDNCHTVLDRLHKDGGPVTETVDGEVIHQWDGNLCGCGQASCNTCYIAHHNEHDRPLTKA